MKRPPLEVADIIRAVGRSFIDQHRSSLTGLHLKVLSAIERCRTAALGGHRDRCTRCGYTAAISYNSCRNRHCPKCQTNARDKWLAAREGELLPVPYVHVVFTLPHQLARLAFHNKKGPLGAIVPRQCGQPFGGRRRSQAPRSTGVTTCCLSASQEI